MLVPVRDIASVMGLSVDWSRETGVVVDGKLLKDYTNTVLIDDLTYVPLNYFTGTAGLNDFFESSKGKFSICYVYNGVLNIFTYK